MKRMLHLITGCLLLSSSLPAAEYQPQEGDIVFQSLPHNPVIDTIEGCTGSPYSDCGIVVKNKRGWWVLEAIGPVQEGPLTPWVAQGRDRQFAVYRLKGEHQPKVPAMIEAARKFLGRPYDIQYELDDSKNLRLRTHLQGLATKRSATSRCSPTRILPTIRSSLATAHASQTTGSLRNSAACIG